MPSLSATYHITTPMFLGGSQHEAESLRPPSVKGALRFWWRAMQWGECLKDMGNNPEKALCELHRREARLFGSAAGEDGKGGQGVFLLELLPNLIAPIQLPKPGYGHQYLLGQGLYNPGSRERPPRYLREAFKQGKFTVRLYCKPSAGTEDQKQLAQSLLLLGLFGGLGSRARKGFGALSIHQLQSDTEWNAPQNPGEYKQTVQRLLAELPMPDGQPPFTAFSRLSRLDISLQNDTAWNLLDKAGLEMQKYRSFGRHGKLTDGKTKALKIFTDDHDLMLNLTNGIQRHKHPRRVVFGLPHNYFFSSVKKNVDVGGSSKESRRASPLFIHPHVFPNQQAMLAHLFMPADFLPANDKIKMVAKEKFNRNWHVTDEAEPNVKWEVIHDLLDRFPARQKLYPARS